jgi:hypothetical protein
VFIVWILIALLAGLLFLLAIPVELAFSVQRREGKQRVRGTFGWLFGLVRLPLGKPKAQVKSRPAARPKATRSKPRRGGGRRVWVMLRSKGFGWRVLRLVRDLLRRIHIFELSVKIRLGLDDPADTGRLWAFVGPIAAMLALPPVARIVIEPEFSTETLEVDGKGHIRIIPIQLLCVALFFLLSPATLRAMYTMGRAA